MTFPVGKPVSKLMVFISIIIPASCSADMSIKLWDFHEFECVKTLTGWLTQFWALGMVT